MSTIPLQIQPAVGSDFAKTPISDGAASSSEITLDCLIIGDDAESDRSSPVIPDRHPQANSRLNPEQAAEIERLINAARLDHEAGRLSDLKANLEKILKLNPDHAQARFNLGVLLRDEGKLPEAEAMFRQAVRFDPRNAEYYRALGELLQMMRHLIFAAEVYEQGLEVNPNHPVILANLVTVRQKQRMPEKVAELSRRQLALDPQQETATISLAWALLWLGQLDEAAEVASRALSLNPQSIAAAVMLQIGLRRLGRTDAADAALSDITQRSLAQWDTCCQAAETFAQFEEREAAEHILRTVIAKQPDFVPALLLLGRYKILSSDLEEGERLMSRVAELDPDEGDAQTSVALTKIRNGDYAEGWSRHHWRWKRTGCEPRWELPLAEWDGRDLGEGGVVLWREQGIGDMVMYAAPAITCRSLARKIVIETNPRLRPLLQRSFPDMIVTTREEVTPDFWVEHGIVAHSPIGDLPHILRLDMNDYPGRGGFLVANPHEVVRLRERYRLLFPGKRLIGISWRSGNSSSAITRSVELPLWRPILETPDCAFISLQYGNISQDVAELREAHGFDVYIDSDIDAMKDMDAFAAQVAAMDLVISVDNSTVHVAGALGKPAFAMIPAASDWRWLTPDRSDSVWYDSLHLFRAQPGAGWTAVVSSIADKLRSLDSSELAERRHQQYLRSAEQVRTFGGLNDAEQYYRAILSETPSYAKALAGLGRIALDTGHIDDAITLLRRAVELEPSQAGPWRDYARALMAGGRIEAAAIALRSAVGIDANDREALLLGIEIHQTLKAPDEVGNYCAKLLRLDPEHGKARLYLAALQAADGDFEAAETNYARVLEHIPGDQRAVFALGCLALRRGDYEAGWRGYRQRLAVAGPRLLTELALPDATDLVAGSASLQTQRLAVRPEAGLRDQIMFSRWLKKAKQEAQFIAAEVDPRLIPLLTSSIPGISLFPAGSFNAEDAAGLELTGEIALADLGARFGIDAETLGESVPYLQFDLAKAAALRQDYRAALSCERLIGICWRGADLAIPLNLWRPILRQPGFGFVSLQPGPAQQELQEVFEGLDLQAVRDPSIDPQSNLRAYAAQVAAMDLVIAIDDVTLHLAGALGVATAGLLPRVADWRWLSSDHEKTPWYPSMHLYRQTHDDDWVEPITKLARELDEIIERSKEGA